MILSILNFSVLLLLVALLSLYLIRFRNTDPNVFSPSAAWLRAGIFFCVCFVAAWVTGTQAMIIEAPVVTPAQLEDTGWIAWTLAYLVLIVAGYWGIWARYTIRFERKRDLPAQIPFGVLWGLSVGQYILVIWHTVVTMAPGWPNELIILVTWLSAGSIFAAWMLFYWDLYVAPEHDSMYSITLKTIVVHIPQTLVSVTYVTLYNNFAMLIAMQTIALAGASVAMRMPAFWSGESTPPARKHFFPFGLVYAGGYVSDDPANDRFLKAAHLPN